MATHGWRRTSTTTSGSWRPGWVARWWPGRGWWPGSSRRTSSPVCGCRGFRTVWPGPEATSEAGEEPEEAGDPLWRTFLFLPCLLEYSYPPWSPVLSKLWLKKADLTPYLTPQLVRNWLDVVVKTPASTAGRFSRTAPTWRCTGDLTLERNLTSVSSAPTPVPRAASSPGTWRPTAGWGTTPSSAGSVRCRSVWRALWRNTWGNALFIRRALVPCL